MGETTSIVAVIMTVTIATQVSRLGPIFLAKFELSKTFESWLSQVPIAILSSLLIPEFVIMTQDGPAPHYLYLLSAVICFVVGLRYKNLLLTTFVGVLALAMCRLLEF